MSNVSAVCFATSRISRWPRASRSDVLSSTLVIDMRPSRVGVGFFSTVFQYRCGAVWAARPSTRTGRGIIAKMLSARSSRLSIFNYMRVVNTVLAVENTARQAKAKEYRRGRLGVYASLDKSSFGTAVRGPMVWTFPMDLDEYPFVITLNVEFCKDGHRPPPVTVPQPSIQPRQTRAELCALLSVVPPSAPRLQARFPPRRVPSRRVSCQRPRVCARGIPSACAASSRER
jgi:hypothetical protein